MTLLTVDVAKAHEDATAANAATTTNAYPKHGEDACFDVGTAFRGMIGNVVRISEGKVLKTVTKACHAPALLHEYMLLKRIHEKDPSAPVVRPLELRSEHELVLEYVGHDLVYARPDSPEELLHVTQQICRIVVYLHDMDIVWLDVKPENVCYNADTKVVKAIDFNLARCVHDKNELIDVRCGTERYTAPEVLYEKSGAYNGMRSDAWSTGITIFALYTGLLPFERAHGADPRFRRFCRRLVNDGTSPVYAITDDASLVDALPDVVCGLLNQCLQPCPAKRPMFRTDEERRA